MHADRAPPRGVRFSFLALSGLGRLMLAVPVIGVLWGLAFWAMAHG